MAMQKLLTLFLATMLLTGCTAVKNLTGQNDDTVLPGQREEVLPPDQQTARDPIVTGEQPSPEDSAGIPPAGNCDPQIDPSCVSSIDQEAAGPDVQ